MGLVQLSFCLNSGVRNLLYPGQVSEARVECWSLSLNAILRQ